MFNLKPSYSVPTSSLLLDTEKRQRVNHDVSDILPSIAARGIYNPIVIDEGNNIIAGARRWLAAKEANLPEVPVRKVSDLSDAEKKILELEENFRRKDISWQETALAVHQIHTILSSDDPAWTMASTGEFMNIKGAWVSQNLLVARALLAGIRGVTEASSNQAAYGFLMRQQSRRIEDAMVDLEEVLAGDGPAKVAPQAAPEGAEVEAGVAGPVSRGDEPVDDEGAGSGIKPAAGSILVEDFITWSETYAGTPFNLIHCDFPYGIGIDKSDQAKGAPLGTYEDSPDTYWRLLEALFSARRRLMSTECHILFWLSADLETYGKTLEAFRLGAPEIELWRTPLIWHKTDNKGIIADAQRGPRHVYEICLLGCRGDRKIVRAVSDTYGAPTVKSFHHSTKPQPMLKHFFTMLVDETTRMLDPTCGSGSSLRAAEELGARVVLGLEKDPEFAELAQAELRRFRILRNAAA